MNPDARRNLPKIFETWYAEETAALVAKGATADDLREEAFEDLLAQKVHERHKDEIKADPALRKEIWRVIVEYASPEELREFAGYFRAAGLSGEAYDLEGWADERQMGEFGD
jgi:hypothetical protein